MILVSNMCGIVGFFSVEPIENDSVVFSNFEKLFSTSESRGKEASGIAILEQGSSALLAKSGYKVSDFLKSPLYRSLMRKLKNQKISSAIGHSCLATNGSQLTENNNQPVVSKNQKIIAVHNGIVTNDNEIYSKFSNQPHFKPSLDSQVLVDYIEHLVQEGENLERSLKIVSDSIEGSMSLALLIPSINSLLITSNTGSLYYYHDKIKQELYFSSEKIFLQKVFPSKTFKKVPPRHGLIISPNKTKEFGLDKLKPSSVKEIKPVKITSLKEPRSYTTASNFYSSKNDVKKLKKHTLDINKIRSMKRCTRCILPFTTPFITFNDQGVCNYCIEHTKITYQGVEALEKKIAKYRKNNNQPDCLVAFSGGRDSAYGLHFVKNVLKMNPMAYTYDWGMLTDIGRNNQARMLGKLGVEHLIISADITEKRRHIRQNIRAWMKKPHLGMVPLFTEGDKQCEFYADKLMKDYDLDLMFFFRGNELEKEEYKTGYCGIKDADPGGVIHNLPMMKKLRLLAFYGTQYLKNPSYFNSSFFDTALAFFSTYVQKHDYLYLWHYVSWNEKEIVSTLKNEYNWQTHPETSTTWRTDDGTSAFFNYIYYQVQGFTEHDSFRARQVRDGRLSRSAALKLVHEENKPRYEGLKWYFDSVGLDGDEVLSVVDAIPKLY